MIRAVLDTQNSTGSGPKKNPPKQPATSLAWRATVDGPASSSPAPGAKPAGSSSQPLPIEVQFDIGRVTSPANMPARIVPVLYERAPGPNEGSPADAKNGADAAKTLLGRSNPYFYDHILYRTDPDYDPEVAKAQAFTALLSHYEQAGDNANIAALLNGLGPEEAAKLLAKAGQLQGPQVYGNGTVYAQNKAGVDQVLAKALLAPGVQLGNGTQQGTLAYSLLQQATSGSNALTIAGILNAAGTSPQAEALKQQFLDGILAPEKALGKPSLDQAGYANAARTLINGDPALLSRYPGGIGVQQTFGSDAGIPGPDSRPLNGINNGIAANLDLYGGGEPGKVQSGAAVNQGMTSASSIQEYLSGEMPSINLHLNEPSSQLLANLMSALGPSHTYAALSSLTPDQAKQVHLQDSLNALVESGQFTADDAKALALAKAKFRGEGSVGNLIASLPDSPNGKAVKAAYAEGCMSGVQQLAKEIASGKYSGLALDHVTATLTSLSGDVAKVSAGLPAPVKMQLFSDLHAAATELASKGDGKRADALNAYAAGLLDQSQIATALRAMGGVGANGVIDPNSELGQFLQSALRGQASFGLRWSNLSPNGDIPNGVTRLLNGIAASGDTKLQAGVLDMAAQWSIKNPAQAAALAAQDTPGGSPGYRDALTKLLDNSFNQFIALDPVGRPADGITMQQRTIDGLQALSGLVMGPPYNTQIAGNFAGVIGKHSIQFAAYAAGQATVPELDSFLAGNKRLSSAVIFGQIMGAFGAGLGQSEASFKAQATQADTAAAIQELEARIVTDYLRAGGTGLLLVSSAVPGGGIAIGGLTVTDKLVSILGRAGLFTGSVGTKILDSGALDDTKTEEQAVQAVSEGMQAAAMGPSEALQGFYDGWFSTISHLPPSDGQPIAYGVMNGYSYGQAHAISLSVQNFYHDYNPMGYYHDQTGEYPRPN
jgi:hypothetical protein